MNRSDFFNDPRIKEAKELIHTALQEVREQVTAPRPPHPELQESYTTLLDHFAKVRGNPLWYPFIGSGFGNGPLVELLDGSVKYDCICGIGVHGFGYSDPELIDVALDASLGGTVMQGNLQQNADSIDLCDLLVKESGLEHCFLTTSGAMANENAFKLALFHNKPAYRILSFSHCFTGRTWACSQITDKPDGRLGLPPGVFVDYVPFYDAENPEESTEKAVATLKEHLHRYPKQHAAMIMELVQGEGGLKPGTRKFFVSLMEVLKEHGVVIIADEIQTFGRTPQLFAFQYFGLEDYVDCVTIGKMAQVCATLYRKKLNPKHGILSQTFTSSTVAIRVGKRMIEKLLEEGYYGKEGKIAQFHDYFSKKLREIEARHPKLLQGPFGIGSMIGFTPFDGNMGHVCEYGRLLFNAGVISFIAGTHPTKIRFLMPVPCLKQSDLDVIARIIEETLIQGKNLCL